MVLRRSGMPCQTARLRRYVHQMSRHRSGMPRRTAHPPDPVPSIPSSSDSSLHRLPGLSCTALPPPRTDSSGHAHHIPQRYTDAPSSCNLVEKHEASSPLSSSCRSRAASFRHPDDTHASATKTNIIICLLLFHLFNVFSLQSSIIPHFFIRFLSHSLADDKTFHLRRLRK